jgi:hypothetical protein
MSPWLKGVRPGRGAECSAGNAPHAGECPAPATPRQSGTDPDLWRRSGPAPVVGRRASHAVRRVATDASADGKSSAALDGLSAQNSLLRPGSAAPAPLTLKVTYRKSGVVTRLSVTSAGPTFSQVTPDLSDERKRAVMLDGQENVQLLIKRLREPIDVASPIRGRDETATSTISGIVDDMPGARVATRTTSMDTNAVR